MEIETELEGVKMETRLPTDYYTSIDTACPALLRCVRSLNQTTKQAEPHDLLTYYKKTVHTEREKERKKGRRVVLFAAQKH